MIRGCLTIIALILFASYWAGQSGEISLGEPPSGDRAEQLISPTGRFTAQLWRCCGFYDYISGFDIYDSQTGNTHRQRLDDVPDLPNYSGGIFFEWIPSENYLVVSTDIAYTSHGCDHLLVYKGDGSVLVFNSAYKSGCIGIMLDRDLGIIDICQNDDILYASSGFYRLTPSTGQTVSEPDRATMIC